MRFSIYSPKILLAFSSFLALLVLLDLTLLQFWALRSYGWALEAHLLDQSRVDFFEEYGFWASSRGALHAYFFTQPIIGFSAGIALRRYMRELLIRNEQHYGKELRRSMAKWEGTGWEDLKEDLPQLPQYLPLIAVAVSLAAVEFFAYPDASTIVLTFLATCGFLNYSTWKRIYLDAANQSAKPNVNESLPETH